MKTAIIIAAHKPYWMAKDPAYMPVLVGAAGKKTPVEGWWRDDMGVNISEKNSTFCELTGHYWLWKNIDADIYGLCHYRRYFADRPDLRHSRKHILSTEAIEQLMKHYDVIVPKKRHYWIETNASQYAHAHHAQDLDRTREVIRELHADYLVDWDAIMRRRSGHRFNMFIMRRDAFEAYSNWLFSILLELEKRLDISDYSNYERRVFGFIAERLLDVWLHHTELHIKECSVVHLESQHWGHKLASFLERKICSEKKCLKSKLDLIPDDRRLRRR